MESQEKRPLVSIIMPSYNCQDYVAKAVASVQSQIFQDWELVICDDCSTDNSREVIEKLAEQDSRITFIKREKNGGTAAARNKGLDAAKGRYISFLDSDDEIYPEYLEKQLAFMKEKNAAIVTASYDRVSTVESHHFPPFIVPEKNTYNSILKGCALSCLTTMYDRDKVGDPRFDESVRKREDFILWLGILKKGFVCYGNKEILAGYRIVPNSKSRKKMRLIKAIWYVYRKSQKLGFFRSLYYLFRWAMYGLKKYRGVK